jgi:tRNA/tmRNA/rRNA uracil-C5-methylase (TrmA/RlmC/RlmD family)
VGDGDAAADGLGWRTRVRFAVAADGTVGLHEHRSHRVVPTPDCRIAHPMVAAAVAGRRFPGAESVDVVASPGAGTVSVSVRPARPARPGRGGSGASGRGGPASGRAAEAGAGEPGEPGELAEVVETVRGRPFRLDPGSFWQIHPAAAEVLVSAILAGLAPRPGETALDLYAGAGLFAAFLAEAVGPAGEVVALEADPAAVDSAARSLADLPQVSLRALRVTPAAVRGLGGRGGQAVDVAVLDPPRAGAGPEVVAALLAHRPRAVAYVACDPAALGRDLAVARDAGYKLASLRAFDLFPMTAHVECVAIVVPQ